MSAPSPSVSHETYLRASALGMVFPGGHTALEHLTFSIEKGEFVSIVGPSGCGKSTLLRLIGGLLAPTRGLLSIANLPESGLPQRGTRTGFVFQDHRLLPWRNATENIRLPMEIHGIARSIQDQQIAKSLHLLGLTAADGRKYPRMLSGGMRMRVSLARALAITPDLLLLDEPFGALDDFLRQHLNEDLSRVWLRQRWTGAFVTHNVAEAAFLSQRILVMSPVPGRILQEFRVPFDYPRPSAIRGDAAFARLAGEVSACLREGSA